MKRLAPACLGLAVLLLAGCPTPQPPDGADASGASATTPKADGPYDPATDPLVNPASLFEPPPADAAQIESNETLYRNCDASPRTLNPLFASSTSEFYMGEKLFTGPFTFNKDMEWEVNQDMTDSWEESTDHLQWTVHLKAGLTWQDGAPFTADDICYSWRKILDPAVPTDAQRPGTDEISNCEALDARTVRFTHKKALPTNKWNVNFAIIPQHLFEKDEKNNPDLKSGDYYIKLNHDIVGNGPYRLVEWIENERIVFERWDGYYGRKPYFRRVVFRIIPDANNMLLSFSKGDIDEFRMSPKQVATQTGAGTEFAAIGGAKVHDSQWIYDYIGYNMDGSNPFFADIRVRKAMTHACNVPRIITDVTYNLHEPGRGIFHPESWMYDPTIVPLGFDLGRAASLLDEAGWVIDPSREGWRHKTIDGKPVRLEFTALIAQPNQTGPQVAAIMQEDLKSIGVKMNTQIIEFATHQERMRKHEYEVTIAAWGTGVDPDLSWNLWVSDQYDPAGKSGRNFGKYSNPRVDELFLLGRNEFDPAKRRAYYQEIGRLIYDDQPYTFLFYRALLWGIHGRIHGVQTGPRGVFNFDPADHAWWVRPGEGKYVAAVAAP